MSVQNLESLVKRLETVTAKLEAVSNGAKPALAPKPGSSPSPASNNSGSSSGPPPSVVQYDDAVNDALKNFLHLTDKLGGDVATIGEKLKRVFNHQRDYIWYAAGHPQPDEKTMQAKLEPLGSLIADIAAYKDSKRNTDQFNHLSTVAEGLPGLYWLTVKPTPAPHIKDMVEASMFFVNRVRKDHKGKPEHEDWLKAWLEIFTNLQKYVRQVHTTGLVYNSAPGAAPPSGSSISAPPSAPSGPGGPPPPPPPPKDLFGDVKKSETSATDPRAAMFAQLNTGEKVTSGLKKVTAEMQTHKNPNLRTGSTVPAKIAGAAAPTGAAAANTPAVQKPPRTELENYKNWAVEYHKNNKNIVIEVSDMKQTVYVFRCEGSVVQVKGKVNSITVDGCKKTSVVFDDLLGQVEVINSQSVEIQTLGKLPTISIQKTDGCQVYLSKDSLNAEIVTSKSSEMNICVPSSDGDITEYPIPEQFKTTFNQQKKKLETTVSDIC